jgi:hypothetical protein
MNDCERYLNALFGRTTNVRASVELRWPTDGGMGRAFYPVSRLPAVADKIHQLSRTTDVYVGVLPRRRQASSRTAVVPHGSVLWVDCDTPDAGAALQSSDPSPSMLVASGTGANRHAYWLLSEPVSIEVIEAANRALAECLDADLASTDPARILRPPSLNHKHDPPAAVQLLGYEPDLRYRLEDFDFADLRSLESSPHHASRPPASSDPLLDIEPALYIEKLTGLRVSRSGKVACPFHQDETPSLQAYRDPDRGWYCYGCRRGGSIYDFAALLWKIEPRGEGFLRLRDRLRSIVHA